jgi:outer membrane receptor protein involved in Fe transport
VKATYVDQDGKFGSAITGFVPKEDQFLVFDASLGYRFPKRLGQITVGAKNIFDEKFKFQDTDPRSPSISPESVAFLNLSLFF